MILKELRKAGNPACPEDKEFLGLLNEACSRQEGTAVKCRLVFCSLEGEEMRMSDTCGRGRG